MSRSIWALGAAIVSVVVVTTVVDIVLHAAGVYPPLSQRLSDA